MKVTYIQPDENGIVDWPLLSNNKKSVVSIGVFDGVHLGHKAVLQRNIELAQQLKAFSVVIMFDPRPSLVHEYAAMHKNAVLPEDYYDGQQISSAHQRLHELQKFGFDYVFVVKYTLAFAAKSYRFFLGQLVGKLGMRSLVLGEDATIGANKSGNIDTISLLAQATGVFELEVVKNSGPGLIRIPRDIVPTAPKEAGEPVDPVKTMSKAEYRAWTKSFDNKQVRVWSSSYVRFLLSQARIHDANEILGRYHAVEGVVVHGEQRGRTIGFPTANLDTQVEGYVPVDGVYAGWLVDLGENSDDTVQSDTVKPLNSVHRRWKAAISIGTKPTYNQQTGLHDRVVEAFAIEDEWIDLYNHKIRLEFAGFLRQQIAFENTEQLVAELKRNVQQTDEMLQE
ncbi:MAG: riboflavin kinase [Bifidobacteriaceae bacterium]|nr:riboflavin kinase [Bifidobacteriaceae bacterium]